MLPSTSSIIFTLGLAVTCSYPVRSFIISPVSPTRPSLGYSGKLAPCHLRSSYPWKLARMRAEVKTSETSKITPVEYKDSWLDRKLQSYMEYRITRVLQNSADGDRSERERESKHEGDLKGAKEYDKMIESAGRLARRKGSQTQELTLRLLRDSFPSWFPRAFGSFLRLFPLWFDARHAAVSTVFLTRWLVGESKVVDVDQDLLDPVQEGKEKWGNDPVGWVPGFLVGGNWRKEKGAGQGVQITRCRVLEQTNCVSVCCNVCKVPTQNFFTNDIGLPLTMIPDYETLGCTFVFGATPPPLEDDEAFKHPCMKLCSLNTRAKSDQEAGLDIACSRLDVPEK
mmetsp:Transcript_42952/g.135668  ORF Transcript_42952/g.135668 Transcript_42952/m.135668 type:complete len:340 (-) Transcript_42952:1920-2939(-)